jgi:LPXTG-motif cell wall-anchored protein
MIVAAAALVAGTSLGAGAVSAETPVEFTTGDYGSAVERSEGSFCWRGFVFTAAEDIEVSALAASGGSGDFNGAIWAASLPVGVTDPTVGGITIDSVVAEVTFPADLFTVVDLSTPVTLEAGQLYVIGLGLNREETGSDESMDRVTDFDPAPLASDPFTSWLPQSGDALVLGDLFDEVNGDCHGVASDIVGESGVLGDTSTVPDIGFRGVTVPAVVTTEPPATEAPTTEAPTTEAPSLPATGAGTDSALVIVMALLGVGTLIVATTRRRRIV